MKRWLPLLLTIVFFTITYLLDIWSTSLFLGSIRCTESNPLFAPFSNSLLLLGQMYLMSWFLTVGSSGYVYLLINRLRLHWVIGFGWYWILWVVGIAHIFALVQNLSLLGVCWA